VGKRRIALAENCMGWCILSRLITLEGLRMAWSSIAATSGENLSLSVSVLERYVPMLDRYIGECMVSIVNSNKGIIEPTLGIKIVIPVK
jgi:hypothetical protein